MPDFMVRQIQTLKPDQKSNINATRGGGAIPAGNAQKYANADFRQKTTKMQKKKIPKNGTGFEEIIQKYDTKVR